jgi:sugar phosphate isomerase/epimerase
MQTDHVVIPIGPFTAKGVPAVQLPPPLLEQCRSAFERWLLHVVDLVNESHFMADFEIVPGSLFPTLDSFNAFRRRHAAKRIGFNFDTGHAHVMREDLTSVAGRFGASLQGTHLRDNFGTDNLALCPGDGSIDWKGVVGSLIDAKYRGPLTMEIGCPSDKVESEYARARTFIMGIVNSISSSPHAPSHRAPGKREETA